MGTTRIAATQLSLPKGGGAIQGIGETFQAAEFTGTASLSIPLPTSPCRGFEPHLSVDYSSGSGNGIFGLGFGLSIPNISRKMSKGLPRYDDADTFLLSNAEDLVPASDGQRNETRNNILYKVIPYHPRLEGLFATIEHWIDQQTGDSHWRVVSRDNVTSLFGTSENARIVDPEHAGHVFQWLLSETFDAKGNCVAYEYVSENSDNVPAILSEVNRTQTANKYIQRIKYGNDQPFQEGQATPKIWHFEVVFDYGEYNLDPSKTDSARFDPSTPAQSWVSRPDPFSIYQAGFEIRTHRLCRHVLMFHRFFKELESDSVLVHATHFQYQESPVVALLTAVESIGFRFEDGKYTTKRLPPLAFTYTPFQPSGQVFEPLRDENGQFPPGLNLAPHYQLIDLYGEGIPGILYSDGRATLYWEPEGTGNGQGTDGTVRYAPPQAPHMLPIEANHQVINQRLMNLTGNGQLDLVVSTPASTGYYEANADHSWKKFRTFPSFPSDFSNPDNHLVDVTGDGLADLLLLEDERIRVYPSLGESGFGPSLTCNREREVPLPRQGAANEVMQFADMFGNGMQHLMRITNGSVECWPNLGYGRFGKRVLFENAPRFGTDLDASRLFLADLDGSGTTDVIYAHPDRVEIFFNQSGNAFSDPLSLPLPAAWDRINQIEFADVYGNGTTCFIFSDNHLQPRHWCYDFSRGQKPYLLHEINNNLGARSTITYCSSTKYYLADKKKGTPWIVNLPFPVQVVEKTESFDLISQTRLVTTYSYHHGYYDGVEREFRGFGLVERQDAETLSTESQPTDVPPVLTRTWYHTGVWQQDSSLSRQYEREYFQQDTLAHLLPDSIFDVASEEADADAWREALRSLKGTVLREEVYSPTAPPAIAEQRQDAPYSVTETNYRVKLLQSKGQNKFGVYFVHPQETLTYDYERNPADPRIDHEFVLQVDAYGNVLRSCAVAYGRRKVTGAELPEQLSLKVTAEEDSFINQTGNGVHLLGVPLENKQYEINGLRTADSPYFTFPEISASIDQALDSTSSRLLSWQRHYYWSPAQKLPYPLGQVSPQALLSRTEEAVVTPEQIEQAFAGALTKDNLDTLLSHEGGYQQDPDKTYWWHPGLTESYLDASQFFSPIATTDPYGNAITYAYDSYMLLPVKVMDALHNQTTVEAIDYQAMAPQQVRDINGNTAEVLVDPLGMVVVTSHYGTENGQAVGFIQLKDYREQPTPSMDDVIAHPQTYLQGANSYFYYDLFSWVDHQIPVHAVSLVATNYPTSEPSPVQISITYCDGFGRAQQSTMKVEPGEAHVINPDGTVTIAMVSDRWLTSGRTVYNNKGAPVKQYEPYYIATYHFIDNPTLNQFGVSPTLFYDPLQRAIWVDTPKGFFSKVEFTPWMETHYDQNDTVKDALYYKNMMNKSTSDSDTLERQALQKAAVFYNTPDEKVLDNLGRTVQDIQRKEDGTGLITYYEWDIQGHQLSSVDPRMRTSGKENFRMTYTLTGEVLKTVSADAGTRWQLHNVMGNPLYTRDSRNLEMTAHYDALHRPTVLHVGGGDGAVPLDQMTERMIYGDNLDENGKPFVTDPEKANLRGQPYMHYDQAGVVTNSAYNILGLPLTSSRQLKQEYKQEANWNDIATGTLSTLLQSTEYKAMYHYDALGRITAATNPDGHVSEPMYHVSGRLNQISVSAQAGVQPEIYVQSIDYDPKGQRQSITYGNGVTTHYEYEPTTSRLAHMLTTCLSDSKKLQDLSYTYDPVGNITHITDGAQEPVFNANQQVKPESDYTYDALYRLIAATGREHPALSPQDEQRGDFNVNWVLPFQPINNAQALQNYTQQFSYDDGGNLYRIQHQGATAWTRTMTVSDSANRAVNSELTNKPVEVSAYFDGNGNQTRMAGLKAIAWNYRDNIANVTVIDRQNAPSDGEYYVYNSTGNRVRKVTESYGNSGTVARVEETIYLGTLEIKRITQGSNIIEERHSLRVMDGQRCVATRLDWKSGQPSEVKQNPQIRYQLDNHLGSATLEVDTEGQMISYEEYFPYGGTALVAGRNVSEVELKQYRYSGKERDSVTGFYYYGVRYYAPWLGRWMSPDPVGTVDGLNLYLYVADNPITWVDLHGFARTTRSGRRTHSYRTRRMTETAIRGRRVTETQTSIRGIENMLAPRLAEVDLPAQTVRVRDGSITYLGIVNGQRGGIRAVVTPSMLRRGTVATYNFPFITRRSGLILIRGHLLARVLGGSGANPRNLVPLYHSSTNLPMYSDLESRIQRSLQSERQPLAVEVIPSYVGRPPSPHPLSLLPTSITVRAWYISTGRHVFRPVTFPTGL